MIHLVIPSVPPSANQAYANKRGGGRILTTVGKNYKMETTMLLTQKFFRELQSFHPPGSDHTPLCVFMQFTLPIYNETFGKPKGAAHRYKQLDTTNRQKLLEDVLTKVIGVDDSNNVTVVSRKKDGTTLRTDILLWHPERETSPFDDLANQLLPE